MSSTDGWVRSLLLGAGQHAVTRAAKAPLVGSGSGPVNLGVARRDICGRDLWRLGKVYSALFGLPDDDRDLVVVVGTWPGSRRAAVCGEPSNDPSALRERVLAVEPDLVVAEGDLVAATTLVALLSHVYRNRGVGLCLISGDEDQEHADAVAACRTRHAFLIGGPRINALSAKLLSQERERLAYVPTESGFEKTSRAPEGSIPSVRVDFDAESKQVIDCAMLLKVKRDEPVRYSFVLMGARQFATCGAVAALRDDIWVSCVMPKVRKGDEFQLLWRTRSGVSDPWPTAGQFVTDVIPLGD